MAEIRKKLIAVGVSGSDQTRLLLAFTKGTASEQYTPTVFENDVVHMEANGVEVDLVLVDTSPQEEFDHLLPINYSDTDVILMCFSIDCPNSLEEIQRLMPRIKSSCPNVPIILVGNNKDLRNDPNAVRELVKIKKEPIGPEEGEAVARDIGAYAYVECSVKTNEGVREVFVTATRAALQDRKNTSCLQRLSASVRKRLLSLLSCAFIYCQYQTIVNN